VRITWSLPVGGERLHGSRGDLVRAARLIDALRRDGHEVHVVERMDRAGAETVVRTYRSWVRRALPTGPALALRDAVRWADARHHGRRVAAAARAQSADVIVETQVHAGGSGALAARVSGVPLILDDCSPLSEAVAMGLGLRGLAGRLFRQQVAAARWATVSSHALRERMIQEGLPSAKLRVIPNGVDAAAYATADRDAERRQLRLEGRCVVGFVGSFQPWHRVELLVQAVALLAHERAHLLLVGDGPGRAEALAAVHRLGLGSRTTAPGAVPPSRVPGLVAACDVGVLPGSNDYGHPMKLLEYAAAGLPAVAPDLAPVREVVRAGVTGLLFLPGDVQALSRALMSLLADEPLRRRLGASARQLAADATWAERARVLSALAAPEARRAAQR
jgi:glycosyltransferase involved in cell wall biosynthesis